MTKDYARSKDELLQEMSILREKAAEAEVLKSRLEKAEKSCRALERKLESQNLEFVRERSELARAQEMLGLADVIIDKSPVILFRREAEGDRRLVYVSHNISRFGYSADDLINGSVEFRDLVLPEDFDAFKQEIQEYAEKDVEEYAQVYRILTKSGEIRWIEDQTSVVRDENGIKTHNQGILIDITERKLSEDQLRKSEEKYRRIVETAGEGFVLMDENLVVTDVNESYCRMIGYQRDEIVGRTPLESATKEFRQFIEPNMKNALAMEYRTFERTAIGKDGRHIPVLVHGNTLRDEQGSLIGHMAFVTDMTEHKKSLALAAEVQKSLLPQKNIHINGLDIAGRSVPCEETGGDYYDYLHGEEYDTRPIDVVVGDITGHGVDAALLMTSARAFLRMRASQPGNISQIVTEMNRHMAMDNLGTGRFMTLYYMSIDHKKQYIQWVRAGHDPAVIYDPAEDKFEELWGNGLALGVDGDYIYEENKKAELTKGQIIAIGTDGIWEAFNRAGEMYGRERFRDTIRKNAACSADDILNAVYGDIKRFTSGFKADDDITLVVIKVDKEM